MNFEPDTPAPESDPPPWHLITGEYPPQPGGVSDYSWLVAGALGRRGRRVHVWCPPVAGDTPEQPNVTIHREKTGFSREGLERLDAALDALPGPRNLLVQWVPQAFGRKSVNVAFCRWLASRAKLGDRLYVMVHEGFFEFLSGGVRQAVAAAIHRVMVTYLVRNAQVVWVSMPEWERRMRPFALGRPVPFRSLPVPSNLPVIDDPAGTRERRASVAAADRPVVGHFGTYGPHTADLLMEALPVVLKSCYLPALILIGRGSEQFRADFVEGRPEFADRVHALGGLPGDEASRWFPACDVFVQPYPDGLSTRRGSAMAVVAHGIPMVTTRGPFTEPFWEQNGAVVLTPRYDGESLAAGVARLLGDEEMRSQMAKASRRLYQESFSLDHTIEAIVGAE